MATLVKGPEHVELAGGWSLWRWACLRGAGFPARQVLDLSSRELAQVADDQLALEATVARAREHLVAACKAAALRVGPEDRSVKRALQKLWKHAQPDAIGDLVAEAARGALIAANEALAAGRAHFEQRYLDACASASRAIRLRAAEDTFRQALVWQNRQAVHGALDALLRQAPGATDSKTRSKERLIASYIQRYAVKNDTIGFFGPCGWATLGRDAAPVSMRPGASLVASQTTYFEYWAIDALGAKLATQPELRPFLAPRRLPRFRLDDRILHYPIEKQLELSPEQAAVVEACDGTRTARQLAGELLEKPHLSFSGEDDVFAVLDELVETPIITWTLELPTADPFPERTLAMLLDRIADPATRSSAQQALHRLVEARDAIAPSRDAAELDAALGAFEAVFTEVTDAESQRSHGQTYAGRTPLYQECQRDLDLAIGAPVIERLAAPLSLVLASARWFTHEIATRYREALTALYRRLATEPGAEVDYARFWKEVPALFPGGAAPGSIVGEVRDQLRARWKALLAIQPDERAVERSASKLAATAASLFDAPGPGWPAARHHSPDVLIAADGAEAIARGNYRLVLGEMHAGFNTLAGAFVKLHPAPEQLVAARDADLDRTTIAPVWSKAITNADYYSPSARDIDLEVGETRSARPRDHVVVVGELVVGERDGAVSVATRDGRHRFDIIEMFEHHLIAESFAAFSLLDPEAWSPRISIDDVIIARETWRVAPSTLAWPAIEAPAGRFLAARRWARELGLPRWVFAKTPEEVKPVYVDFESALYIELFAKLVRSASSVTISEMLPSVQDTWLEDANAERYTSELRIVAVDPVRWQPPRGQVR